MTKAILINYEYCTGCHSCEVACKDVYKRQGAGRLRSPRWRGLPLQAPRCLCRR